MNELNETQELEAARERGKALEDSRSLEQLRGSPPAKGHTSESHMAATLLIGKLVSQLHQKARDNMDPFTEQLLKEGKEFLEGATERSL